MYATRKQLIEGPNERIRPHVVLLGAGASRAAFPSGDGCFRKVPVMNDLLDIVGLKLMVECFDNSVTVSDNFEDVYSLLKSKSDYGELVKQIEDKVEGYFASLQLPDRATLYDRLLLSLRQNDAIFTFNWDPFLFDAYERNRSAVPLPDIFFLHGNVRIGQCPEHPGSWGRIGYACTECARPFEKVPLLYPINQKGYSNHPYIQQSWNAARALFQSAFVITIFGYGAPESDQDAVELLKSAWLKGGDRKLEHVEIIDIADTSQLYERWKQFTPTCHLHFRSDFDESWIALWPRRSREAIWISSIYGNPCEQFPWTTQKGLTHLQEQAAEIARYEV